MAMFGLPGGSEWLVIVAVIVLLFVPGIVVFGAGFLMGRKEGEREARAEDVTPGEPEAERVEPEVLPSSQDKGVTGGGDDA